MSHNAEKKKTSVFWKIATPIFIGMLVVWILLQENFHADAFLNFHFTGRTFLGITLALLAWVIQNSMMSERFSALSSRQISFRAGVRVNFLTEFTSVATPSSVGGSSAVFLFLAGEGVNTGKATAITISALFLDEFFISLACLSIIIADWVLQSLSQTIMISPGVYITFVTITVIVILWTIVLAIALFVKPQWVGKLIRKLFHLRFLKRFRHKAEHICNDLITTSIEMRHKPFSFWLYQFVITSIAWMTRFAIAIALIYGFSEMGNVDLAAYIRQFIIWMVSMISPTPGGSGLAEYMFKVYYSEYFSSEAIALVVAVIWRAIGAYSYLIIGGIILSYQMHKLGIKVSDDGAAKAE